MVLGSLLTVIATNAAALELNSASQAELERLRGIGPALSGKLLDERARQPFADWTDLQRRVGGLRDAAAGALSAQGLRVNGRTYESQRSPARADER